MNPLTNIKNITKLSEQELKRNFKTSWHDQYKDSAWVFIGGLPYDLTEGDVICVFSQYGEVVNMNLVRDKGTGKSKGFCFLCYEDQRSTVLAVDNFNGMKILGRTIRVDHVSEYRPPKESKTVDDVTKMLYETGCAPGSSIIAATSENRNEEKPDSKEGILKKVKKEKKKRVKKQKKSAKKRSSKKRKKRNKEESSSSTSSSESSTDSSESSSSEEEDDDSEQAESKGRGGKKKDPPSQRNPKEWRGECEEQVRVKVEEEEEEKRRARREQRASPSREGNHGNKVMVGGQRNGAKSDDMHPSRSINGEPSRWGQDSDRRRPDRGEDVDVDQWRAEQRREGGEWRGKHRGGSKDERQLGKEGWDSGGASRKPGRDGRDGRDEPSRRDEPRARKERHERYETAGLWKKGERFGGSHQDRAKWEERRHHDERSRSPCERESGKSKRSTY
ncbi:RNA-binding motif protein, X-linked 2-like [Hetaerina americana]|uniref:RNA-binding motif protein, X-linked 2-like n=1 Tax=Hetaerina americana TaxID=62018 RepID=UPI003A7F3577